MIRHTIFLLIFPRMFPFSAVKKLLHKTGMSAVFRFLKNPFIFFRPKKEEYPGYNPDALSTKKKGESREGFSVHSFWSRDSFSS